MGLSTGGYYTASQATLQLVNATTHSLLNNSKRILAILMAASSKGVNDLPWTTKLGCEVIVGSLLCVSVDKVLPIP